MNKEGKAESMKTNIDITKIQLGYGGHSKPETIDEINTKVCALEWVSILAGEKFSDHPECACPVIAGFVRSWNDAFPQTDEGDKNRTETLRPLLPLLLNTRVKNDKVMVRRAFLALDWLIRTNAPAFLSVGGLEEHAQALRAELEVDSLERLEAIRPVVSAAESAAYSAARSAAYSAAESAAYSAARSAARSAAESAAESAARSAAESAAYSAAESAAQQKLAPVVAELQASAQDLVRRMIDVTPETVENWDWNTGAEK